MYSEQIANDADIKHAKLLNHGELNILSNWECLYENLAQSYVNPHN